MLNWNKENKILFKKTQSNHQPCCWLSLPCTTRLEIWGCGVYSTGHRNFELPWAVFFIYLFFLRVSHMPDRSWQQEESARKRSKGDDNILFFSQENIRIIGPKLSEVTSVWQKHGNEQLAFHWPCRLLPLKAARNLAHTCGSNWKLISRVTRGGQTL